ncbi:unnamed protein product [Didymodactylos carnosus]|uniref:Malate synthase n=1 Tax=Didymodactylos carnosus TaxID=1234261 RepID=A0A813PVI4_9BILA|nr:unnamed protein product [Didymodactylos carnosus]CAF3539559.1 unnamed protein product [Didymodactylos carnosus]
MSAKTINHIITPEAIEFLKSLHLKFNSERQNLLQKRLEREKEFENGVLPNFLPKSKDILSDWKVASTPTDLEDRRVEITGPVERKMICNALNSGANVFMADFEDSLSPTWTNIIDGQINLYDAVRRTISFTSSKGKTYKLTDEKPLATLVVRPRGWHLNEIHFSVDDGEKNLEPISASLFDFGLYFFHNVHELLKRGSGPYFYLPKLENHLEARLWNNVFNYAQDKLNIKRGTIRATILIETILAAYEMEEILFELKDHASGLNAGRWDYLFSCIKKFPRQFVWPDRQYLTMTLPFMRTYTHLLVDTCHKHQAHAIGGMSAFIPTRKDFQINEVAFAKVRDDKQRESEDGFDGTWVAHPDLVQVAKGIFDRALNGKLNQKHHQRTNIILNTKDLFNFHVPEGKISEQGLRNNINVALQYIQNWIHGTGAVAINNLMEDAATAEISRAQIWQWIQHQTKLCDNGKIITKELYQEYCAEEIKKLEEHISYSKAKMILDELVLNDSFIPFLTLIAYKYLDSNTDIGSLRSSI